MHAIPDTLAALGFTGVTHSITGDYCLIPPLCTVPAGAFIMGGDDEPRTQRYEIGAPRHQVFLPTYRIGMYPLTVAEYGYALNANAQGLQAPVNWEWQCERLTFPVTGLTWYDAISYVLWLTEGTGDPWRLPSEAEWEKAARGTDGRRYPWGDLWDERRANVSEGTTAVDAHPLGASPYGVLDLVGNVDEWTSTIYDRERFAYPYRLDDGRDDTTVDAWARVMRGGCWLWPSEALQVTCRNAFHTSDRFDWLHGTRLVLGDLRG